MPLKNVICPCGIGFSTYKPDRSRYHSKKCFYKYRTRSSGLVYNIVVENKAWIKKGQRLSPKTEFKTGETPYNFKGDKVGYDALHDWVKRHRGKAKTCEFCGSTKNVQWANKSHEYIRILSDWLELCYRCHRAYDMKNGWGSATKKYPEIRRKI